MVEPLINVKPLGKCLKEMIEVLCKCCDTDAEMRLVLRELTKFIDDMIPEKILNGD